MASGPTAYLLGEKMNIKQKPIASAVALALYGAVFTAQAQQPPKPQQLDTITVTGIRGSVEKSLETKREADGVVEVITAEDIGKMPDKNVADSLSRVVGITTAGCSRWPCESRVAAAGTAATGCLRRMDRRLRRMNSWKGRFLLVLVFQLVLIQVCTLSTNRTKCIPN